MQVVSIDPGYRNLGLVIFSDSNLRRILYARNFDLKEYSPVSPRNSIGAVTVVSCWYERHKEEMEKFILSSTKTVVLLIEENGQRCHLTARLGAAIVALLKFNRPCVWDAVYPTTIHRRMISRLNFDPLKQGSKQAVRQHKKKWTLNFVQKHEEIEMSDSIRKNMTFDQADAILNAYIFYLI